MTTHKNSLRIATFALASCLCAVPALAQTVTTNVPSLVASGQEWAATSMKDPIDMDQWTDVGWWNYSNDAPRVNLQSISQGTCTATSGASPSGESGSQCFRAAKGGSDGNIFILDTPIQTITTDLHKSGTHFPIDATTYTTIVIRMRLTSASGNCTTSPSVANCTAGFIWWPTSIFASGQTQSASFFVNEGWGIYFLNIPALGYAGSPATPWSGVIRALRLNLAGAAGAGVEVDWIRLVPAGTTRTITWSGFSSAVDLYLDNNNSASDGNLGIIAKQATDKSVNVGGSSYTFDPSGLAPGTYYVEACNTGTAPTSSSCRYSSSFTVNDIPMLTFTSPSPEGSSDDFATTVLGNPWNMDELIDIDYYINNTATPSGSGVNQGLTVTTITDAVTEAGLPVSPFQSLYAASTANADPQLYPLWFNSSPAPGRGQTKKIDSNKYHILTIEAGVPNRARDIANGSVARVFWQVQGERGAGGTPKENVSGDILFNHRGGYNVLTKITADMKTLALETDPGSSPSTTGWKGNIESFRFDTFELFNTAYYVKRIKLAAKEQTTGIYTIRWSYSDANQAGRSLTLSYDTDTNPASGLVTIRSGLDFSTGSYSWNTAGVPNGTYYIYASYSDGLNTNASHSRWPIVVGPLTSVTTTPSLVNIITTKSGSTLPYTSPPQEVTVTTSSASMAWTATANQPWVQLTNASGTGSGRFTVSLVNPSDVIGNSENLSAVVTVSAGGQTAFVTVTLRVKPAGTSDNPHGSFDTPASSSTALSGSFPVTGWALDDIGIERVEIWRDRVGNEAFYSGPGPGNGKVYIANPFFVAGARTDVESAHSDHPFHNRAGWGYLLLSYGLPNQGNGTFTLYAFAYDYDGHVVTLGTKTIVVSNATATKPFGSIDTPTFGQTVSGNLANFGWALTPNATPTCRVSGGSVGMSIDSGPLVPVSYGQARSDIAAAFPGFSDGNNAGGLVGVDTTTLGNGTHQIGWYVVDSCGRADGVGSRFFNVLNSGSTTSLTAETTSAAAAVRGAGETVKTVDTSPIAVQRHDRDWQSVEVNSAGLHVINVDEGERIEVQLPALDRATYQGSRTLNGVSSPLPLGSSLDASSGVFYWEPVAGFLGTFDLEFAATRPGVERKTLVRVVVGPSMRTAIDSPQPGVVAQQPFWISGWTADLGATEGAGIDAVHVWAYPVKGGAPVFVGFASIGDARTDVAAVYGQQFQHSAYNVLVTRLTPGAYDVVVYPHRVATNTFDGAQVVRVTVR